MAILNFPGTVGAATDGSYTYTENNVIYSWNGSYWSANNTAGLGGLTVSSLNGGPLAGFRNQLINSSFDFWQRSTNGSGTGYRSADRWRLGGSSPQLVRRVIPSAVANAGVPCTYAGGISGSTNPAAAGAISQTIELPGGGGRPGVFQPGSQWTLSFYTDQSNPASIDVGQFSFCDDSSGGNSTASFTKGPTLKIQDINGTWGRYSVTVTIDQLINGSNAGLKFSLGSNADGTEVQYTGIQFEPGSVATPLEHHPIGTELALCQRYFVRLSDDFALWSGGTSASAGYATAQSLPVEMRVIPTASNVTSWLATPGVFADQPITCSPLKTQNIYFSCSALTTAASAFYYAGADLDAEL